MSGRAHSNPNENISKTDELLKKLSPARRKKFAEKVQEIPAEARPWFESLGDDDKLEYLAYDDTDADPRIYSVDWKAGLLADVEQADRRRDENCASKSTELFMKRACRRGARLLAEEERKRAVDWASPLLHEALMFVDSALHEDEVLRAELEKRLKRDLSADDVKMFLTHELEAIAAAYKRLVKEKPGPIARRGGSIKYSMRVIRKIFCSFRGLRHANRAGARAHFVRSLPSSRRSRRASKDDDE